MPKQPSQQGQTCSHNPQANYTLSMDREQTFRRRFWVCLVLSIPALLYSPTLQAWLERLMVPTWLDFSILTFPGSVWVTPLFALLIFFYGGVPFLRLAGQELRRYRPGMMTFLALILVAALAYSLSTLVRDYSPSTFIIDATGALFWELVVLIEVMLFVSWLGLRRLRRTLHAQDKLAQLLPATVERITAKGKTEEVAVEELQGGDLILAQLRGQPAQARPKRPLEQEEAIGAKLTDEHITQVAWHSLSPDDALKALQTKEEGLSKQEVEERQQTFGPNTLPEEKHTGLWWVFIRQFKDPLIYILLIAGIVSLAIGNFNNALFIFAVLMINAVIGAFQEWKAQRGAEALQQVMQIHAIVQRDGRHQEVDSSVLVPGDIVFLESGAAVPADIRLLSAQNLNADESLLTGESLPVTKAADLILDEDVPLGDRQNLLHAGSSVLDGRAKGVVCRTGAHTEVGKIAESLAREEAQVPPLVARLKRFTRQIGIMVLIAIIILSVLQLARGAELVHIFFLGVALAVSAIPAGLPVAITVAMAIGSNRMAVRNVIVRQLPAVEGLGSCTLVASDKTGTLTTNVLTIKRLKMPDGDEFEVAGQGYDPEGEITRNEKSVDDETKDRLKQLAITGALCNEGEFRIKEGEVKQQGDTVDVAFLVFATKLGLEREALLDDYSEVGFIPFRSQQRFAASLNRMDGNIVAHVKGAAEALFAMCDHVDKETVKGHEEDLAQQGFRMLALARGRIEEQPDGNYDAAVLKGLEFLGLAALIDPIRPEVPDAVARCHSAGVDVRMITGDHPATALTIAQQLNIAGSEDKALTGQELKELESDEDAYNKRIAKTPVFARIEPTQKTEIIESLQAQGHFVAVTGDGVNDAPALKSAHIGVAMGQAGTDVARGAADLILTDDNFASIVNGIEEGRIAYDNVRKVTWLLLSTGAAEVLLFFLAILTGLPLPLNAVQLLWLNLVTNGIQDVALAFEKGEPGVLNRPPRPPNQPIFDRRMIQQTLLSGGYIGCVAFGVYYVLLEQAGMSEFDARNLLLLLMVLFENMHCFSCRSETRSLFRIPLRANPLLILTVIAAQGVHIIAMFIPGLSDVLEIEPVTVTVWLTLLPIAASLLVFDEVVKFVHAKMHGRSANALRLGLFTE